MTQNELLQVMQNLETGDQAFFGNSGGLIEETIHWSTNPWQRFLNLFRKRKKLITHHAGTVLRDDGKIWLVDSTLLRGGVSRRPLESVLRSYPRNQVDIVRLPLTGYRDAIKQNLVGMEGLPYERVLRMYKVPLDQMKEDRHYLFCIEACVYALQVDPENHQLVLVPWTQGIEAFNTDPDEWYRICKRHEEAR